MASAFDQRSLGCLDWPALLEALAGQARSARGRAACQALPLAVSREQALTWAAEVSELAGLLRATIALPALDLPDVEDFLDAAEQGLLLGADELRPVATACEVAAAWARFFADGDTSVGIPPAHRAPAVAASVGALTLCASLATEIRATFDPAGEIRDSVSPELARLRREREGLSARVRGLADELMRGEEFAGVLQDQFVTMRGDRYVLPLRASAKSLGLGIVHDTSRTGETVFVEPTAMVVMNNRLKLADLDIQREIRRILELLARRVADAAPALRANADILTALDVTAAKARLGVAYDGYAPVIARDARISLVGARHPLLVLRSAEQGFPVVANDVALSDGAAKVLIISGPNAGGKTVLLKTVGLAAVLARAGMLVPAEAGAQVGFFDDVLADVGDRQSVMGDLSTFSAHLQNLAEILNRGGGGGEHDARCTLVLLDELMAGTNPEQGAALARATAERLADAAGLAVITTHYDSLKGLAQDDGRFCNAGMEYDPEHLRPTFRLKQGTPGRSYALDIAARMGLPDDLLVRARTLAGGGSVGLEEVITSLEAREVALREETERLAAARISLAESEADQRAAEAALVRRERELGRHSRAAIDESVREARESLRAIVRDAQQAGTARAAEAGRAALAQVAEEARRKFPVDEPVANAPAALTVGMRVHVPSMDAQGVVVKLPDSRGRVKVTVGAITLDVDAESLGIGTAPPKPKSPAWMTPPKGGARAQAASPASTADSDALTMTFPTASTTLDLRGERVDEAVGKVEAFLDRAALDGRSPVFVIHGHGTGALRKAVREYLGQSRYVRRFQPGGKGQGGDGVTVIDL